MRRPAFTALLLVYGLSSCSASSVPLTSRTVTSDLTQGAARNSASQQFLYALPFSGGIAAYALPIVSGEQPSASTTIKAQSLAVRGPYLFAATNNAGNLAEFKLPLANAEKPLLSLAVSSSGAIAASKGYVFVGTTGSPGAVFSFATPLRRGERASDQTTAGIGSPAGLAANSTHLYVNNQNDVTSYPLPLQNGEKPDGEITGLYE